jgi:hypothetical protein
MGRVTVQWAGPSWLRRPAEAVGLEKIYTRVTNLSLTGPVYTDRAVEHLVKLRSLESLSLSQTKISSEGRRRLQKGLPDCRIDPDERELFWRRG